MRAGTGVLILCESGVGVHASVGMYIYSRVHLSVLVAVSSGVFEVLAGALVAVRVQVDGARRSLG